MKTLSDSAFAILACCSETKEPFGITVDQVSSGLYQFVWAFKIDKKKAHREGYDQKNVNGGVIFDKEFPGCPHCGEKRMIVCGKCNTFFCHHGEKNVTCPECGFKGEVTNVSSVNLKGGGY